MLETRVKKIITVGNGLGIVIPKDVLENLELEKSDKVKVTFEKVGVKNGTDI